MALRVTRTIQLRISSCYFILLYGPVSSCRRWPEQEDYRGEKPSVWLVLQIVGKKRFRYTKEDVSRSQWPRGLRHRPSASRLLGLWVRIPPGTWMYLCCECRVLSGRGLCDGLITRPEESYRLFCVVVCNPETSLTLRRRIKSHLLFAGIIRSSLFSPR